MAAPELLQREVRRLSTTLASSTLTDRELLVRFVATRNDPAFTELVRRHGPMVLGTCRRLLRQSADADDAFQAVFLVLLRQANRLRDPDRLGPWLYRVAWRIATKLRQRRVSEPLPDELPAAESADWLGVFDDVVATLPEKYRTPLVLCYLQGLSANEAALQLGCAPATIGTRLHRGREQLRRRLAKRGLVLPTTFLAAIGTGVPTALADRVAALLTTEVLPSSVTQCAHRFMERSMLRMMFLSTSCVVGLALVVGYLGFHAEGQEPTPPSLVPPAAKKKEEPPPDPIRPASNEVTTANFHVIAKTARQATLFAETAERVRKEQALAWLGKELPPWDKPVEIKVEETHTSPTGATTFAFDASDKPGRWKDAPRSKAYRATMLVAGELDTTLLDTLPHEVTHCVLATHFGTPVPRWADEGMATLSESADSRRKQTAKVASEARERFPLDKLLPRKDYPTNVAMYYAQSYALCEWLVARKDRATLVAFVTDGLNGDWAAAAKKHYGFANLEEMEAALGFVQPNPAPVPVPNLPRSNHPQQGILMAKAYREGETITIFSRVHALTPLVVRELQTFERLDAKGQLVKEKVLVPVLKNYETTHYYEPQTYPAKQLQFKYPDGKVVPEKELAGLLKRDKPTPVVVVFNADLESDFAAMLQPRAIIVKIGTKVPRPPVVTPKE